VNKSAGEPGNKHFKCYHGNCKVLTITWKMLSNLNGKYSHSHIWVSVLTMLPFIGLINHLKVHFPVMYQLFLLLKDQNEPPTEDKIAIGAGKKALDHMAANEYLVQLEKSFSKLIDAFHRQNEWTAVH
jgi:hypothetical protein